jgi:hypothetical protein
LSGYWQPLCLGEISLGGISLGDKPVAGPRTEMHRLQSWSYSPSYSLISIRRSFGPGYWLTLCFGTICLGTICLDNKALAKIL